MSVGVSLPFNLLTEQQAAAENYPFCTIEPNESRCAVPDQRFKWLCDLWHSPSQIPAYFLITGHCWSAQVASEGAILAMPLSHICAVDLFSRRARSLKNPEVVHVDEIQLIPLETWRPLYELCRKDTAYGRRACKGEQT
jgi:hypothetical protein